MQEFVDDSKYVVLSSRHTDVSGYNINPHSKRSTPIMTFQYQAKYLTNCYEDHFSFTLYTSWQSLQSHDPEHQR